jgi:hypothetical protein
LFELRGILVQPALKVREAVQGFERGHREEIHLPDLLDDRMRAWQGRIESVVRGFL